MVAVVPLTIVGGLFTVAAKPCVNRGPISQRPSGLHTFRFLSRPPSASWLSSRFAIAFDLGTRLKQDALVSAVIATVIFMMIQINPIDQKFVADGLGAQGLFTAILIAPICVRIIKLFTDLNLVIKLPDNGPQMVYESFLSLVPLAFLVIVFWLIRRRPRRYQSPRAKAFSPLVFALNTLPGILVYAAHHHSLVGGNQWRQRAGRWSDFYKYLAETSPP
jgi:PTS system cellobiose-specific IIC component